MSINVFEGARRIGKLVALLWVAGFVVGGFNLGDPYIEVGYTVSSPERPPARSDPSCEYGDNAREYITVHTKKGTKAHVTLCFLAQTSEKGRKVIPYRVDRSTGTWFGNSQYDAEVKKYMNHVKEMFVLDQEAETWIDGQWWPRRLKYILELTLWCIGGLVFLWGMMWAIGWIVRGFLGIPKGQDKKSEPDFQNQL